MFAKLKQKWLQFVCDRFGHAPLVYKGYAQANATLFGKPWRFKVNYAVFECPRCKTNNKTDGIVKIEELWRSGIKHKRTIM